LLHSAAAAATGGALWPRAHKQCQKSAWSRGHQLKFKKNQFSYVFDV
jgi:hypothetical protein